MAVEGVRRAVMGLWLGLVTVRVNVNLVSSPETSMMGVPSGVESGVDYNQQVSPNYSSLFGDYRAQLNSEWRLCTHRIIV